MKILVIGDSCIDKFIYCDVDRICPEAPVPVLRPAERLLCENQGMAANVARNIEAMVPDGGCDLVTNMCKIVKTRYVHRDSGQMVVRVDEWDRVGETDALKDSFLVRLPGVLGGYDAVVVSDYDKGFVGYDQIRKIGSACARADVPSFIDTKKFDIDGECLKDYFCLKVNRKEYDLMVRLRLYSGWHPNEVVTLGAGGCELHRHGDEVVSCPQDKVENVGDLSGAGDTFLAALAVSYVECGNLEKAMVCANDAAGVAVSRRGVVSVPRRDVKCWQEDDR